MKPFNTSRIMAVAASNVDPWVAALRSALPHLDVRDVDDEMELDRVTYAVMGVLKMPQLDTYPNLEAIFLLGAGFNHLDLDHLPDVPIIRLIDPAMAETIARYVLSWVIHFQLDFDRYAELQAAAEWNRSLEPVWVSDFTVGVFGAGAIGQTVLDHCSAQGFPTIGWSRSNHDRPVEQFFADCDVVVDLLPLNPATRGAIGSKELEALGNGVLINVGRGPTVDTAALLRALDGELRAAVLDVTDPEPLPADSPLWSHPKVTVTPHISGRTDSPSSAQVIASSVASLEAGVLPDGVINR